MIPQNDKEVLLICDLNVFVMAYIFDSSSMLSELPYLFGKIFIHQTVYDELSKWQKSVAKKKKFGEGLINSMLEKCGAMVISEPILAEQEKTKYFHRILLLEKVLEDDEKSADTSSSDKTYLALAIKTKANLATQEKTLRNVSRKVLGEKRVFDFSDMIIDKFHQGQLDKQKVEDGLKNLAHYEENFVKGTRQNIFKEIGIYNN
ncbi:MAG: hypothetical protein HQK49_13170 [Oligoflexia bacterium]|nr:hypothetical protein [Oligoflexia bacterium]